ncbi:cell division protein ZapA [Croceibacterium sp. TMG7-5b_MA50]|uniref:cell division protein ZapA n=1 Tax=Croceibacterium sp. TMG7-5b_MA50 TaxID=3121290 RepID=UPI00322146E2
MSNVDVTIGGRAYTLACAPGEEAHLQDLGRFIDERLQGVPGVSGQSEVRRLLYAALLLADELHEAREQLATARGDDGDSDIAEALEALADRMEALADTHGA